MITRVLRSVFICFDHRVAEEGKSPAGAEIIFLGFCSEVKAQLIPGKFHQVMFFFLDSCNVG